MPSIGRRPIFLVLAFLVCVGAAGARAQTKLLRFPDLHADRVVFTHAGDLWLAPASGGTATRLTAHPGLELFAKFSPDGRWIAFTGQYDGDEQVYVVPAAGGVPRQLTFYPARGPLAPRWGYDNQVLGWTRGGGAVLFRSLRDGWDLADSRLYTVPAEGGPAAVLPMPIAGPGDFSPDGKQVVYTPIARDFRTWKRYQGGWAQDLWIFDLASHESRNITQHPRTDRDAMWMGEAIVFNSDRDGTLNLYAYDTRGGQTRQLTRSTTWDVRWPSAGDGGRVVYELDGELEVLDVAAGAARHLTITVPDDGLYSRPRQVSAAGQIEDFELSPKGERALFVARGDVFTAPIEKGLARNLTRSSGAHDKWARWSPDGRQIAYISDASGEEEVWLVGQDGTPEARQLTAGGRALRYAPEWAGDGKRLAFGDKDGRLWVVTVADGKLQQVADDAYGLIRDYAWSPCGGHLAFTMNDANGLRSLWMWSVADARLRRLTDENSFEASPAWDPKGDYLYFLGAHEFAPLFEGLDFDYLIDRNFGVYALALRRDTPTPLPVESDEVTFGDEKKEGEEKADKDDKGKSDKAEKAAGQPAYARIDFEGLAGRVIRLPVAAENYFGLAAKEGHLLYVRASAPYLGREPVEKPSLRIFSLKDRKETVLAEGVGGYALSRDGAKVLVEQEGKHFLYDAKPEGKDGKKEVATGGLVVDRVPKQEWAQIFDEVWRRYRDFFYVENMHGYDWPALRAQYRPLVDHVAHRSDLNYVIGEMIAELNVSHAYIAGGDFDLPERPRVALPGARFTLDAAAGRHRIARIFAGDNQEERYRSPLTEVGVDARVGDYVLAIDGVELGAADDPYRLLRHKAGQPVRLTLNDKPGREGAREVTFQPVASETNLLYLEWVTRNREKVAALSGGRVGYLHVPDMGEDGLREFIKWYYPQIRKQGLIVDVRDNGGGFVSQTLIERLRRTLLAVDFGRLSEHPSTYPAATFHGHLACLINEGSASDGDIFPAMFRQAGLGPLIGKRTWGGVVGISGRGPLVDGGQIFVPEAGSASVAGEWTIEGYGVDPDIVVDNDPKSVAAGADPQLERGVAELLAKIAEEPRLLPKKPADPVKTQAAIG